MNVSTISLLLKRQLKENFKMYTIGLLVLFALLLFMFLIVHQWQDSFSGAVQNGVFIIGLFIGGGVFSNSMFQEFSSPQSGMWLLSIPATHTEKVITSILMSTVLFLVVYIPLFYLADLFYLSVINTHGYQNILNLFKDNFYHFFFIYLLINGFILLGSVIFNKHSFIKTLLAGVLIIVLFNYINSFLLELLIPEMSVVSSIAFDSFLFRHEGENVKVVLPENVNFINSIFIRIILPVLIWITVGLKLKEKQI